MRLKQNWKSYCSVFMVIILLVLIPGCSGTGTVPSSMISTHPAETLVSNTQSSVRMALWLAQKDDLLANADARFDLVMSGWFDQSEAATLRNRLPSTRLLAGLTLNWVTSDPSWQGFLTFVANNGDPNGPLQIDNGMYLMLDDNGDGNFDAPCSPPGWDNIYAMDPRDPAWRKLVLAFYANVASQTQHDGVIVDMVDAYPFCEGGRSGDVPTPLDTSAWVSSQAELLGLIRENLPAGKWIVANAGHDFPAGSPFPQYVNGYLLENFLGTWGAGLEEGLASAQRALSTTLAPHIVVFAVDTDNSGVIDWKRFRTGLAASLLLDNTYFAFDYGSRDHGGVTNWWYPQYYGIDLGMPAGSYSYADGIYRRDFENGVVVIAAGKEAHISFDAPHVDVASGDKGLNFVVSQGDAGFFVSAEGK